MAKGNKSAALSSGILFFLAAGLLCAGWLMKPFPVFIFASLAPLFAITDQIKQEDHFWNRIELVLLALVTGFLAAHFFDLGAMVICLLQAMVISFSFMGATFVHQRLGLGKVTVVFFWLAAEYLFAILPWRDRVVYLGDAMGLRENWLSWTHYTGYAGTSLWILLSNLFVYYSFFREGKVNWYWVTVAGIIIAIPVLFSYLYGGVLVSRTDMIILYSRSPGVDENPAFRGEVIHKAAAIVALVLLVAAFFRNKKQTG